MNMEYNTAGVSPVAGLGQGHHCGSYVEWSAIFGGTVVAVALSTVLLQFGSAIGFANMDTLRGDLMITPERLIYAGVFVLIVQVLASVIGGYLAGRMRMPMGAASEHEREVRDGAHGLLVWATGMILVAILATLASTFADHANVAADVDRSQDVVEHEHKIAIITAFAAGATSLVSAVAAWVAGVKGGDHRDQGIDMSRHISFRRRNV